VSNELSVLQAVRLKGRVTVPAVAICAGLSPSEAGGVLVALADRELVVGGPSYRITPAGRDLLARLIEAERAGLDAAGLEEAYDRFENVNSALKVVITAWQMRDASTPNDHADGIYDAEVLGRLDKVDSRLAPILKTVIDLAPRLTPYQARFAHALECIDDGDVTFVASPIKDSYHQVWFEFHEELIGLLGRSRVEEAAAGRA
jgi:pyruvate,orthophosphate dikinase